MSAERELKYYEGEQLHCITTGKNIAISEGVIDTLRTALMLGLKEVKYTTLPECFCKGSYYVYLTVANSMISVEYKGEPDKPITDRDWVFHISY